MSLLPLSISLSLLLLSLSLSLFSGEEEGRRLLLRARAIPKGRGRRWVEHPMIVPTAEMAAVGIDSPLSVAE